jgi:hypothetical protein
MAMVPSEVRLAERMKGKPFVLVGVNGDSIRDDAKRAVEKKKITWPSFWSKEGPDGPIPTTWNVRGWPTVYVIDPNGVIRFKLLGYGPGYDELLNRKIDQILGQFSGKTTPSTAAAAPPPAAVPAPVTPPVRIKAGLTTSWKDSEGNEWLPDQGFADGDTTERPDNMKIDNTTDPAMYRTERYGMTLFSYPVPNGKYIVKLHFAETYDGITGPGQRVFSFNVQGQEFKNFDIWVKAGGPARAYIKTVNVEVTDGKLNIRFTPNVENPEINGIEILPAT